MFKLAHGGIGPYENNDESAGEHPCREDDELIDDGLQKYLQQHKFLDR